MGEPRTYRSLVPEGRFASFTVRYKETDLWIGVDPESSRPSMRLRVLDRVIDLRTRLDAYIERRPEFLSSFEPLPPDPRSPALAAAMAEAASRAGVGPMAAVAGAFADCVARALMRHYRCREVIVENGGDIALYGGRGFTAALHAGSSPLSGRVGLRIRGAGYRGIATSAGRTGPSYSAGRADACAVLASDAASADAFATAFANRVGSAGDIGAVLARARRTPGVLGFAVVAGFRLRLCRRPGTSPPGPGRRPIAAAEGRQRSV